MCLPVDICICTVYLPCYFDFMFLIELTILHNQVLPRAIICCCCSCWLVWRFRSLVSTIRNNPTQWWWVFWCRTGDWFQVSSWELCLSCRNEQTKVYKGIFCVSTWNCSSKLVNRKTNEFFDFFLQRLDSFTLCEIWNSPLDALSALVSFIDKNIKSTQGKKIIYIKKLNTVTCTNAYS